MSWCENIIIIISSIIISIIGEHITQRTIVPSMLPSVTYVCILTYEYSQMSRMSINPHNGFQIITYVFEHHHHTPWTKIDIPANLPPVDFVDILHWYAQQNRIWYKKTPITIPQSPFFTKDFEVWWSIPWPKLGDKRWQLYFCPNYGRLSLGSCLTLKPLGSRLRYAFLVMQIRSQYLCPRNRRPFKVIQGNTITLAHPNEPYIYAEIWEIRGNPFSRSRTWVEDAAPQNPLPHLWRSRLRA